MLRAFSTDAPRLANLDRFSGGAARFSNAFTTSSWTLPAHGSLMTGLYPDRHGATDPRRRLSSPTPHLAELLRRGGYRTIAFTDGGLVHRRFGFAHGFERYDDWGSASWPRTRLPRQGEPSDDPQHIFDRALAFLSAIEPEDSPFFLFVHTYSVHNYYLTTPDRNRDRNCVQGRQNCPAEVWKKLWEQYRAQAVHLDVNFGRLLSVVDRGPTILIVLSDHGEGFDPERGRIHHGGRLHEDLVRVPLLISGPGIRARDVVDPVSVVDVTPTLLDLVGLPSPPGLDGRSFAAAARGARATRRPLFAMEHYHWWEKGRRREVFEVQASPLSLAVIAGDRWLIQGKGGEELYDMSADPNQHSRLGDDSSRSPLERLAADRLQVRKPEETSQIDEALRERLRALGYLD